MKHPNYNRHDSDYRQLREKGYVGWGGEHFERRMQGWKATVDTLFRSDVFPKSRAEILEIGSGAGDSLIPFAEQGYQVTGIEISPVAVKWAEEKFAEKGLRARFYQGDIAKPLPFKSSSFSAVLDGACLHCIIGLDRAIALAEIFRVLHSGGFLLISHMVNDPREMDPSFTFNSETRTQERDGVPYRSMPTYDQLTHEVRAAGFEMIHQCVRQNSWWDHAELWCLKKE